MFDVKQHIPAVERALSSIGYDFTRFEVDHFVQTVAKRRKRPIEIATRSMSWGWFGVWMQRDTADYIFVNETVHPVMHIHSLLHEIGHMVLGHHGDDLNTLLDPEMLASLGITNERGHLRASGRPRSPEDSEAELFVFLLQRRVMQARRLSELYGEPTSIEELKPYARGMDFNS